MMIAIMIVITETLVTNGTKNIDADDGTDNSNDTHGKHNTKRLGW